MAEHAKHSPSHASTWAGCTSSTTLEPQCPEKENIPASLEGTYAHGIVEQCLIYGAAPLDILPEEKPGPDEFPASLAYDRFDIADNVQVALDYVNKRVEETGCQVLVENKLEIFMPDCWGTADITLVGLTALINWVETIDFKYGKGIMIDVGADTRVISELDEDMEVVGNKQLQLYSIGNMQAHPGSEVFKVTIIQPRIEHPEGYIRSTEYTHRELKELQQHFQGKLDEIASGNTSFNPCESACMWCRAKGRCTALAELALPLTFGGIGIAMNNREIEQAATQSPDTLTMDQRVAILQNIELCRAWLKAVQADSLDQALTGVTIRDFKVVVGDRTIRRWDQDPDEMLKLFRGKAIPKGDVTKITVLGPAPVEKLLKRLQKTTNEKTGKPILSERQANDVMKHIIKPQGKRTLVPASDARPGVALTNEAMFGKPETNEDK